jgi:hypothetical protein
LFCFISFFAKFSAIFILSCFFFLWNELDIHRLELREKDVDLMTKFERLAATIARLKVELQNLQEEIHENTETMESLGAGLNQARDAIAKSTASRLVGSLEQLNNRAAEIAAMLPHEVGQLFVENLACLLKTGSLSKKNNTNDEQNDANESANENQSSRSSANKNTNDSSDNNNDEANKSSDQHDFPLPASLLTFASNLPKVESKIIASIEKEKFTIGMHSFLFVFVHLIDLFLRFLFYVSFFFFYFSFFIYSFSSSFNCSL